jgi:GNAT superfamily N-acetyltransferase
METTSLIYKSDTPLSDEELQDLFADAWDGYEPRPFGNVLRRSLGHLACWDGEDLVGFVNVAWDGDKHAFILDTTVRRSHQRAGIGRELVRRAADIARDRGAEWLHVDFEPHLLGFYRQCGFLETAAGLLKLR